MEAGATPSARIVAEAASVSKVTDADGRVLQYRRPGALDRLRMFKALGSSLAENDRYFGYAILAMCVVAIDDVPIPQPSSEALVEGLVGRLGDVGLTAIARGFLEQGLTVRGVAAAGPGNGEARPE